MPVKPNFRVLIDNREINSGDLFIPESPAPPGWEVKTFHGGIIKFPTGPGADFTFNIGNTIAVKINENKVNGMESDSQSYNLKPMALNFSYDAMISGATLDFNTEIITITVKVDGQTGNLTKFIIMNNTSAFNFHFVHDVVPGQHLYTITRKMDGIGRNWGEYKADLYLHLMRSAGGLPDLRDIDYRNNNNLITFRK
jgi:hypothetical protein